MTFEIVGIDIVECTISRNGHTCMLVIYPVCRFIMFDSNISPTANLSTILSHIKWFYLRVKMLIYFMCTSGLPIHVELCWSYWRRKLCLSHNRRQELEWFLWLNCLPIELV